MKKRFAIWELLLAGLISATLVTYARNQPDAPKPAPVECTVTIDQLEHLKRSPNVLYHISDMPGINYQVPAN